MSFHCCIPKAPLMLSYDEIDNKTWLQGFFVTSNQSKFIFSCAIIMILLIDYYKSLLYLTS